MACVRAAVRIVGAWTTALRSHINTQLGDRAACLPSGANLCQKQTGNKIVVRVASIRGWWCDSTVLRILHTESRVHEVYRRIIGAANVAWSQAVLSIGATILCCRTRTYGFYTANGLETIPVQQHGSCSTWWIQVQSHWQKARYSMCHSLCVAKICISK